MEGAASAPLVSGGCRGPFCLCLGLGLSPCTPAAALHQPSLGSVLHLKLCFFPRDPEGPGPQASVTVEWVIIWGQVPLQLLPQFPQLHCMPLAVGPISMCGVKEWLDKGWCLS